MSTGALCTIVSGTPGVGKTSLAVSMIDEFLEKQPGRPLFVMGIPELAYPHEPVPPVSEWTEQKPHPDDPSLIYPEYTFPDGSLVVIDEAQNVFRPRASGSRVPDHVAAMERHRHKGIDFILITQSPTLIDGNIRRLCGKHVHIRSLWSGRKLYEWAECANPESVQDRDRATVRRYALPKKVFGKYKSATLHVKQTRRIPKVAYLVLLGVVVLGFLGHRMTNRIQEFVSGEPEVVQVEEGGTVLGSAARSVVPSASPSVVKGGTVEDYIPRLPQRPETAPLYDSLRQPKVMPLVVGCMAMGSKCRCITQQGTDAFLEDAVCRAWIDNPPFNPYHEPAEPAKPASRTAGDVVSGEVS